MNNPFIKHASEGQTVIDYFWLIELKMRKAMTKVGDGKLIDLRILREIATEENRPLKHIIDEAIKIKL